MRQVNILIKNNIKLLFRNKAFLFVIFFLPILSLFVLNIKVGEKSLNSSANEERQINELQSSDFQIIYRSDSFSYTIKVYDSSDSELTDYVLNQLLNTGMFEIYRYQSEHLTEKEILEKVNENVRNDMIGCILYFSPAFDTDVLSGEIRDSIILYRSSDDERKELFEHAFLQNLSVLLGYAKHVDGDSKQLLERLLSDTSQMYDKEVKRINDDKNALTYEQKQQESIIGYSYAILTLGFLFCGIFIAYTVIEERDNRIYIRFTLSNIGIYQYIFSKLAVSIMISMLQTVIIGIGFLIIRPDSGISIMNYLFLIMLMGTIFNTLSLCIGVVLGNVMGANYAAFAIWSLSCMLSGLYFPIDRASGALKTISYFMPQRWFLKAAGMIMTGDHSAYLMTFGITMAFLIFILSMGAAGLKLKSEV